MERNASSGKVETLLLRLASYAVIGGISLMLGMVLGETPSTGTVITPEAAKTEIITEIAENPFITVAEKVQPAVVQITTTKEVTGRYWDPFEHFSDSPLEDLFEEFFGQRRERRRPRHEFKRKQEGLGSGFIINKEGYILTNYHVIRDVDKIQVKLSQEDKVYEAKVIGEPDAGTDIALIKIEPPHPLTVAKLGDSSKIKVGEWVLAIGNPFGLEATVTQGIISAKGRSGFYGMPRYQDFIQTTASINLGNSGGPLVNMKGEVIGINTFVISPYVQGFGFAIPISMAKDVYEKILKHGRVVRGHLGVGIQNVDPAMTKPWKLPGEKGVVVSHIIENTPASRGGLEVQDVIIEFDGKEVTEVEQLQGMVADTPVGKKVKMKVIRDGKEKILTVTIAEMPSERNATRREEEEPKLGLVVREITQPMVERYDLEETRGVIVVEVEGGSPAARKIQAGDIIKKINKREIESIEDYYSALDEVEAGKDILFFIRHGKYTSFVVITAE